MNKVYYKKMNNGQLCIISPNCKIRKNVEIGHHVIIEDDVEIGDNVIIGAMSFVNKDVRKNETWIGIPTKKV